MPEPAATWTDTCACDPEPDDGDDGPWCRTPGLLPEQRERVEAVDLTEEYL